MSNKNYARASSLFYNIGEYGINTYQSMRVRAKRLYNQYVSPVTTKKITEKPTENKFKNEEHLLDLPLVSVEDFVNQKPGKYRVFIMNIRQNIKL